MAKEVNWCEEFTITKEQILAWLEKQNGKDKLIKELGEYKVKYTQEVLSQQLEKQREQKSTSDIKYKVSASGSLSIVNGKPFDYEHATITQKDFASINDTDEGIVEAVKDTSILDMVEPKFKVGDFIVYDYCMGRVVEITNDAYLLDIGQGIPFSCEDNVHLWTIKDANEGNIIAGKIDGDNYIFIFKTIKDGWIETYGHYYNAVNRFCVPSQLFCRDYQGTFTPATEEQRDLLFAKMKEAGYEWDDEKKELKKIEKKPTEDNAVKASEEYRNYRMSCGINDPVMLNEIEEAYYEGAISRKSAEWSEEDDYNLQCMTDKVTYDIQKGNVGRNNELMNWLKSLKDRVQPKQEWSKEDENVLEDIKEAIINYWHGDTQDILLDWIKSLKDKIRKK